MAVPVPVTATARVVTPTVIVEETMSTVRDVEVAIGRSNAEAGTKGGAVSLRVVTAVTGWWMRRTKVVEGSRGASVVW
jgi:hypothetical protein